MNMKSLIIALLFLCLLTPASALDVPPLRGHVNDTAGMLSTEAAQRLEVALTEFEQTDSTQIVVLTIPTLAGENLEEYSIKVAEAWRIGQKGLDNGAILLLAQQERKVRIEVGRGLEGKLTDLMSGRIIRDIITPRLRAGDIDGGIQAGVSAIMEVVRGEYQATARDLTQSRGSAPPMLTLLFFLFVAITFLGGVSRFLGGVAGGVGLPVISSLTFSGLGLFILGALGLVGFIGGMILASIFRGVGRGGRRRSTWGGPFIGGGWGGGSSGGGFSGGGFSGGGGSFGGGGASGSW
jgi:uncharacterized protein